MNQPTPTPLNRRLGARLTAALGIFLAASWGPFSQTLRLIEVSESGKPGAESSFRIVLACDCNFINARQCANSVSKTGAKQHSRSENKTTERLLNAVPETLESAQSIHFDLSGAPVAARVSAWIESEEIARPVFNSHLPETFNFISPPVRGPPTLPT